MAPLSNDIQGYDHEQSRIERLPGVNLNLSVGKEVVLKIDGHAQKYTGMIVGYDPYDYIIIKSRIPSALRNSLAQGGTIIVRYVRKGTVFGFRSHVSTTIAKPTSLLFITYPESIEHIVLRKHSRQECSIDSVLEGADWKTESLVINVSETGCKLSARIDGSFTQNTVNLNDILIVAMDLGKYDIIKLPVIVRNKSHDHGILSLGCLFMDSDKNATEALRAYLDKLERLTTK